MLLPRMMLPRTHELLQTTTPSASLALGVELGLVLRGLVLGITGCGPPF
jgi:hypothetical protein